MASSSVSLSLADWSPRLGAPVRLRSIMGRRHLNGCLGVVVETANGSLVDKESRRCRVQLQDGSQLRVALQNLAPFSPRRARDDGVAAEGHALVKDVALPSHIGLTSDVSAKIKAAARNKRLASQALAEVKKAAAQDPYRLRNLGSSYFKERPADGHPKSCSPLQRRFPAQALSSRDWRERAEHRRSAAANAERMLLVPQGGTQGGPLSPPQQAQSSRAAPAGSSLPGRPQAQMDDWTPRADPHASNSTRAGPGGLGIQSFLSDMSASQAAPPRTLRWCPAGNFGEGIDSMELHPTLRGRLLPGAPCAWSRLRSGVDPNIQIDQKLLSRDGLEAPARGQADIDDEVAAAATRPGMSPKRTGPNRFSEQARGDDGDSDSDSFDLDAALGPTPDFLLDQEGAEGDQGQAPFTQDVQQDQQPSVDVPATAFAGVHNLPEELPVPAPAQAVEPPPVEPAVSLRSEVDHTMGRLYSSGPDGEVFEQSPEPQWEESGGAVARENRAASAGSYSFVPMSDSLLTNASQLPLSASWLVLRLLQLVFLFLQWLGTEIARLTREAFLHAEAAQAATKQKLVHEAEAGKDGEFVLQQLKLSSSGRERLSQDALEGLRAQHQEVRISLVEAEPPAIVVLGPGLQTRSACVALAELAAAEPEPPPEAFFALHFTMREAYDLPENDELTDASLDNDWVDLGAEDGCGNVKDSSTADKEQQKGRSPQSVLLDRLREVLPTGGPVQVLLDRNPFASWGQDAVRVDLLGPLEPSAWSMATRAVLACEALGVYLSRQYDAVFWCPDQLQRLLEDQVESALCHWKGSRVSLGSGFGLAQGGFPGFEDLAANVSAVLRGETPPGWHRLEWTPHGEGSVPHLTY